MDDQALLEGIVVFSDEDGPGNNKRKADISIIIKNTKTLNGS